MPALSAPWVYGGGGKQAGKEGFGDTACEQFWDVLLDERRGSWSSAKPEPERV